MQYNLYYIYIPNLTPYTYSLNGYISYVGTMTIINSLSLDIYYTIINVFIRLWYLYKFLLRVYPKSYIIETRKCQLLLKSYLDNSF